jgi:hypothetical protein
MVIDPDPQECTDERRESHGPANQAQHAETETKAAVASWLHPPFACRLGADCPAECLRPMGIDFIVHVGPPGTGEQTPSLFWRAQFAAVFPARRPPSLSAARAKQANTLLA